MREGRIQARWRAARMRKASLRSRSRWKKPATGPRSVGSEMLRLAFVPLLKQQRPEFLIDAPARTDIDDIHSGLVIIRAEDNPIRSDPQGPVTGEFVVERISHKRVVAERTDAFSD